MNLLKRRVENTNIFEFRKHQYELIPEMFDVCFEYLRSFGMQIDPEKFEIIFEEGTQYISQRHYATQIVKVKLDKDEKDYLFQVSLPVLLNDMFFHLNGAKYVPVIYITDSPIIRKKKSIKLYSLFKPITIYNHNNRVIFLGGNIQISRFFRLYYTEDETRKIMVLLNSTYTEEPFNTVLDNIARALNTVPELDEIKNLINKLFFDRWTLELYKKYYNIETPDLKSVLDITIDNVQNKPSPSFIDLKYKRLVFIEYLLDPLFKAISNSVNYLLEGKQLMKINIGLGDIVQFFFTNKDEKTNKKGLEKSNFYDTVNGFSCILGMKVSFKTPRGTNTFPSEISSIHPSYKRKICPVSISSQQPGIVSSLIPKQKIDLRYGLFL